MTDREKDIQTAIDMIGQPDDYFRSIWEKFMPGWGWDGAECSEIACCISFIAGNADKIPAANYAELLCNNFRNRGAFDHDPQPGDFIFFGYHYPEHTGRVIDISGGTVTTVEGNVSDHVVKRYYDRNNIWIYGYGHPAYDIMTLTYAQFFSNAKYDISLYRGVAGYDNLTTMIQSYLKESGYYTGYLDGDFGSYTESAVKAYQQDHDLVVDGIVGRFTWEEMIND